MNRQERGWAGERYVKGLLEKEGWFVVDLAPSFPCDLLGLFRLGDAPEVYKAIWVEVKVKAHYKPRLTPPEASFLATRRLQGDSVRFYWLRREGEGFRVDSLPVSPPSLPSLVSP